MQASGFLVFTMAGGPLVVCPGDRLCSEVTKYIILTCIANLVYEMGVACMQDYCS